LSWKKQKIEDNMFVYEIEDRRMSFRISPSNDAPVSFSFGNKSVNVINIGASGLCFKNNGFTQGESHLIELELPGRNTNIAAILMVIEIDDQNVCHCLFKEMHDEAVEEIHQYVLEQQKEYIRKQKEAAKKIPLPN